VLANAAHVKNVPGRKTDVNAIHFGTQQEDPNPKGRGWGRHQGHITMCRESGGDPAQHLQARCMPRAWPPIRRRDAGDFGRPAPERRTTGHGTGPAGPINESHHCCQRNGAGVTLRTRRQRRPAMAGIFVCRNSP
jgi:hypothetical protein